MITQPAMKIGKTGAIPATTSPVANSGLETPSTKRPPRLSMAFPTRGDTMPETSNPTDNEPMIQGKGQPVSARIGAATTVSR